jgi:hypothetical protein
VAINHTTLSGALTDNQTTFAVASTTNITAPTYSSFIQGSTSTWTYLYVEAEMMFVTAVPISGTVTVIRGVMGTIATTHATSALVIIGTPADFPNFTPQIAAFQTLAPNRFQGISSPVAAAATLVPSGPIFHVTGSTATSSISLPTNFVEGAITVIADAVWTWTSSSAAQGIAQAGTVTSLGSTVTFTYDANTSLWYPSRLA